MESQGDPVSSDVALASEVTIIGEDKRVATDPAKSATAKDHSDTRSLTALLKRHASFASMGEMYLARIVAESRIEQVEEGDTVIVQGELGNFAYLVLSGEMAIAVDTPRGRTVVAVSPAGDLVGEIGAFAATPRTASVTARTPARLLKLEQSVIRSILADHPEVAMSVINDLGQRLQSNHASVATLIQATSALARGEFEPDMIETLKNQADRFSHLARVFENMVGEITDKRARRQEMETAADIQRSFLPRPLDDAVTRGRFDAFASMEPASEVGGDFYDYFMIDDDHLGFAVGDVSGKGVPAAIFMSVSRTVLRTIAREGVEPGEALTRMNNLLAEDSAEAMFVTLFYGKLDLTTGRLAFCSAGHDEIYLLTRAAGREKVGPMGPAIGLIDGIDYPTRQQDLAPGDMAFISTDGVTEAFSVEGNMFGEDRLVAVLDAEDRPDACELVENVTGVVAAFARGAAQSDDITCLAIAYRGAGGN